MAGDLVVRIVGENSSLKQTMREGAQITREFMTEQEQNSQQLQRIGKLYEAGAISADTLSRAVAKITEAENASGKAALIAEEKMLTEIRVAAAQERAAAAQREMKAEQELTNRKLEMDQRLAASNQMAMDRRMARVVGSQMEVQALERTAGGTKNLTFAVQQLAFGAQDAATVFGNSGFAGAVRAASNNIIQAVSLINPLAGTIAAVAGTGIALFVDWMFKSEHQTKKVEEKVRTLADAFADLGKKIGDMPEAFAKDRSEDKRLNSMNDPKEMKKEIDEFRARTADLKSAIEQRENLRGQAFQRQKKNDDALKNMRETESGSQAEIRASEDYQKLVEENRQIEEERQKLAKENNADLWKIDDIDGRRARLERRLPGAQSREEDEFDRQQRKKAAEERQKMENSVKTPAEKMADELDRLEQLKDDGVINVDTFDRAMGKARKEFEDAMERLDPLRADKQFAKQLEEKVKTPAEKLGDERQRIVDLQLKGLIDGDLASKAMDEIKSREEKLNPKEKPVKEVRQEENRALLNGTTEAYKAIIQAQKQNDPMAKLLNAANEAAKDRKAMVAEQKRANQIAENQKIQVIEAF